MPVQTRSMTHNQLRSKVDMLEKIEATLKTWGFNKGAVYQIIIDHEELKKKHAQLKMEFERLCYQDSCIW